MYFYFYDEERRPDMAGLGVLFFIGIYFFIAYKIVKATKTKRMKWLAILILVLIPTADEVVGRIYLQHLCATEGGLKVYQVAQGVEGFVDSLGPTDYWVKERGYQFIESPSANGRVVRFSRENGQIIRENDVAPKSLYRLKRYTEGEKDSYLKYKLEMSYMPKGEILSTHTQIGFNGGWVARLLASFGGANPVWCRNVSAYPETRTNEIILSTLKP